MEVSGTPLERASRAYSLPPPIRTKISQPVLLNGRKQLQRTGTYNFNSQITQKKNQADVREGNINAKGELPKLPAVSQVLSKRIGERSEARKGPKLQRSKSLSSGKTYQVARDHSPPVKFYRRFQIDEEAAARAEQNKRRQARQARLEQETEKRELKERQRREIYALNREMTRLENEMFETFMEKISGNGEQNTESAVVLDLEGRV